jgi:hypothetical protein
MSSKTQASHEKRKKINTPREKKAYKKPSFRHERVFETLALACGKTSSAGPPQCQFSRKSS